MKELKGKVVPLRSIEAHLGDRRYSSCSFLTSALEGGEWSASRPGRALPPGKEPLVPTVQEAEWAPEIIFQIFPQPSKSSLHFALSFPENGCNVSIALCTVTP
jgi:hypothetical protein